MTEKEIIQRIDALAKKRDHAADILKKPFLALSYQREIDQLVEKRVEGKVDD